MYWNVDTNEDVYFQSSGFKLIKTIKERCNISFLKLRFQEDKELNGSPHKPFVD